MSLTSKKKYKTNLQTFTKRNESLEKKVSELEVQLSRAYSRAMSTWAQDVSRDVPDDVIRNNVASFLRAISFLGAPTCAPRRLIGRKVTKTYYAASIYSIKAVATSHLPDICSLIVLPQMVQVRWFFSRLLWPMRLSTRSCPIHIFLLKMVLLCKRLRASSSKVSPISAPCLKSDEFSNHFLL